MTKIFVLSLLVLNFLSAKAEELGLRQKAEAILKTKCMDCHSQQTVYPWYANFPIAKQLMEHDIKKGRAYFNIENDILAVESEKDIQSYVIERLNHVISNNEMPPIQFRAMHWDKIISTEDKEILIRWTEQLSGKGLVPLPSREEIISELKLDKNKIKLGEKLYHDTRLSGDNTISCASCHDLAMGGTDQAQFATGIDGQIGHVNSPTVYNSVYNFKQFWDGRAEDLTAQAHGPVNNPSEMGSNWEQVIKKIKKDKEYMAMFKEAFAVKRSKDLSGEMMAEAIAEFEKTLVTPDSPFDLYLKGDDKAVSDEVKQGYKLFKQNNCMSCHSGIALGGKRFAKMGVVKAYKDFGDQDFKVPLLRNIAITYPYLHDGSLESLEETVGVMAEYQVGKKLPKKEIKAITAFLESLTGKGLE